MPHVVIAPDKFKGSLTAAEVCQTVAKGIRRFDKHTKITELPLADGGEGTLDILTAQLGLQTVQLTVNDPLFRPVAAYYGMGDGVAYVEMATASGLALLTEKERNPLHTTSYGTGELMLDAIRRGATRIYLFVGGSATNDAGIGMAQALGYQFLDASGTPLSPIGQSLARVAAIRSDQFLIDLDRVEIFIVTDVDNPLYGASGAAQVYGPQKGADDEAVRQLEQGLINIAERMAAFMGRDVRHVPGTGAAGGIGAGAISLLRAQLLPGVATIIGLCQARDTFASADLVISGEGKLDGQTLRGKVVKGVSDLCPSDVPLGVICGTLTLNEAELRQLGVWRAYAVKENDMTLAEALARTEERVEMLAYQMMQDFTSKT